MSGRAAPDDAAPPPCAVEIPVRVQAIVFDLDDTLIDTTGLLLGPANAEAAEAMVAAGLRATREGVAAVRLDMSRGGAGQDVDLLTARRFGGGEEIARAGRDAFYRRRIESLEPLPGVPDLLLRLRRDRRIFLVTAGDPETQRRKVEIAGLAPLFDEIRCVGLRLEDKESAIRDLLATSGTEPGEAVVVGDRVDAEIEAGRRIGCWTVLVRRGEGRWLVPAGPLQRPHHTIPDPRGLVDVLAAIEGAPADSMGR